MNRKENTTRLIENLKTMILADTGLRDSQVDAMNQFLNNPNQPEKGVFNLATGVGKTRIMSMLALAHIQDNPKGKVIVVVPNTDLIEQERNAFQEYREAQEDFRKQKGLPSLSIPKTLDTGAYYTDSKDTGNQIIFTTYSSLEKLGGSVNADEVELLLLDEAHHGISEKRTKAIQSFSNAMQYGMTATPFYDQERNIENVIGPIIAKRDVGEAIREGDLAECKNVLMVSNLSVDLTDTHATKSDFREEDFYRAISKALHANSVTSGNEDNWQQAHHYLGEEIAKFYHDYVDEHVGVLNGKKCLINCRSQEEARIQAQELNKLFGRIVAKVHTSDECDDQTIKDFREGNLSIVCQVGKLTEGFDMPNLDMTINYPTCSRVREAQGAARCLRKPKIASNQPNIEEKKMGIVVDVAFKHPKYESTIDSIHQNGQVLFQDILENVIIQHNDKTTRIEEIDKETLTRMRENSREKGKERAINFQIISELQELVRLTNEEKELKEKRFVADLPEDMLSHKDLAAIYHKSPATIEAMLIKIYGKKILIQPENSSEEPFPMVTYGKRIRSEVYAVKNSPIVLQKLEEMYPELLKTKNLEKVINLGEGRFDLGTRYNINPETVRLLLKKLFENKVTFYKKEDEKKEKPISVFKELKRDYFVLDQDPMVLKRIEELFPKLAERVNLLVLTKERDGSFVSKRHPSDRYLTPSDFIYAFGVDERSAEEILKKAFEAHETFFEEGDTQKKKPHPLALYGVLEGKKILAMPDNEMSRKRIRELYSNLLTPPYRPRMITLEDMKTGYFWVNKKTAGSIMQYLYDKKAVFYADEDVNHEHPIPFIEYVKKDYGLPFLALTENPKGQLLFKQISESYRPATTLTETLENLSKKGSVSLIKETQKTL